GSQALAAGDTGDGDAEVDHFVAILRQCAGAEADDRRAGIPEGSPERASGTTAWPHRLDRREGRVEAHLDRCREGPGDPRRIAGASGSGERSATWQPRTNAWRI